MGKGRPASKSKVVSGVVLIVLGVVILGSVLTMQSSEKPVVKNSEMLADGLGHVVSSGEVEYFDGTSGFLAEPEAEGVYPGVIMIHEWWGLNDGIKDTAVQLASKGYVVLAVDLYDGKVAATPQEARNLTSSLDKERAVANMRAAASYLRSEHGAPKVASLGWCFGGGQSMQLALSDEEVDATVIYYGSLVTDEEALSSIEQPVLGIFGGNDTSIPVSTVMEFDSALDSVGVENEIYIYDGVGHAFANPSGMNYAPDETRDAWLKTVAFLERHLKSGA